MPPVGGLNEQSMMRIRSRFGIDLMLLAAVFSAIPLKSFSQDVSGDLSNLSIENLLNLRVTSVSRRQEELRKSASAVYVITQEDIRRSGVTDIAEVLRMVPGVNVARINQSTWAISSRGFNDKYA